MKSQAADPKLLVEKQVSLSLGWQEKWGDKLERLNNGFIVFKPTMFSPEYITIPYYHSINVFLFKI